MANGKSTWKYNKLLTARNNYFDIGGTLSGWLKNNTIQNNFTSNWFNSLGLDDKMNAINWINSNYNGNLPSNISSVLSSIPTENGATWLDELGFGESSSTMPGFIYDPNYKYNSNNKYNPNSNYNPNASYLTDRTSIQTNGALQLGDNTPTVVSKNNNIDTKDFASKIGGITGLVGTAGKHIGNMVNNINAADVRANRDSMIASANNAQLNMGSIQDFDGLMNAMSNTSKLSTNITGKDLGGKSGGQIFGESLLQGLEGSAAGFGFGSSFGAYGGPVNKAYNKNKYMGGGPIGAIIGGVMGTATSLIGNLIRNQKANKYAGQVNDSRDYTNDFNERGFYNTAQNLIDNQMRGLEAYYNAYGGNLFADGGRTHGTNFSDGLMSINEGGWHEENPLEGVPMGIAPDGTPNLVEEGETIFNDYVFSKRINVDDDTKKKYKLGGNMSFADASKKLAKESEERPNDPISKAGLVAIMNDLMTAQETIKQEQYPESQMMAFGGHKFDKGGPKQFKSYDGNYYSTYAEAQAANEAYSKKIKAERQRKEQLKNNKKIREEYYLALSSRKQLEEYKNKVGSNKGAQSEYVDMNGNWTEKGLKAIEAGEALGLTPENIFDNTSSRTSNIGSKVTQAAARATNNVNTQSTSVKTSSKDTSKSAQNSINAVQYGIGPLINPTISNWTGYRNTTSDGAGSYVPSGGYSRRYSASGYTGGGGNYGRTAVPVNMSQQPVNVPTMREEYKLMNEDGTLSEMPADFWYNNKTNFDTGQNWSQAWGDQFSYNNYADSEIDPNTNEFVRRHFFKAKTPAETKPEEVANYYIKGKDGKYTLVEGDNPSLQIRNMGNYFFKDSDKNGNVTNYYYDENKPYEKGSYANWLRYAPVVGLGISSITDAFGLTNKPNYGEANALLEATRSAGQYQPVKFNPIGNYLTYNPMDRDYYINKQNAVLGSTMRNIMNTSGGNRGTAMAGSLAAGNNYFNGIGELARQAEEMNRQHRMQIEEFNRGTNTTNSQGKLQADTANQSALASMRDFNLKGTMAATEMMQNERARADAARSRNISGFFQGLGDMGYEEQSRAMVDWGIEHGVYGPIDQYIWSRGKSNMRAKGGKIKKRKRGLTI